MKIELLNKIQLDEFIGGQSQSQLLQSWDWGEFQHAFGRGVWRIGVFSEEKKVLASAQIFQHQLPLKKSYLYCPRGPVFEEKLTDEQKQQALRLILSKIRDIIIATSQTEEIFFRLEPNTTIRDMGLEIRDTKPIQPANTLILDLQPSTFDILKNMHPKTRYNIGMAEKHKIIIKQTNNFEEVWPVFKQTSARDKFNLHPKNYYLKMLETVPAIKLFIALKDNAIMAGNLIGFCGDTVTYLHGASDYENRKYMAPYLLQWEVIKQAKNKGYKYYDFHGIAPTTYLRELSSASRELSSALPAGTAINNQQSTINNHPWHGLTRFKKGFGGQVKNYPGTFDFIYQPKWYILYKLLRQANGLLRKI